MATRGQKIHVQQDHLEFALFSDLRGPSGVLPGPLRDPSGVWS